MEDLMFNMEMDCAGALVPDAFHAGVGLGDSTELFDYYYGGFSDHPSSFGYNPDDQFSKFPPPTPVPSQSSHCTAAPMSTCAFPYMSEQAEIPAKDGWLEETVDLSNFLRHEALSPSTSNDGSVSAGSVKSTSSTDGITGFVPETRLKSPMEIYREIEHEATHFAPVPADHNHQFQFFESSPGAFVPMDSVSVTHLATLQPMQTEFVVESVATSSTTIQGILAGPGFQGILANPPANHPEMSLAEVEGIIQAQPTGFPLTRGYQNIHVATIALGDGDKPNVWVDFPTVQASSTAAPAPEAHRVPLEAATPSVTAGSSTAAGEPAVLQVVQIQGDQVIFPDGTRAVLVKNPTTDPDPAQFLAQLPSVSSGTPPVVLPAEEEVSREPSLGRKRRPYQKGSYERKKLQNRESALRYRNRIRREKEAQTDEYELLLTRNVELKGNVGDLQKEIVYWKKFMLDLQSKE